MKLAKPVLFTGNEDIPEHSGNNPSPLNLNIYLKVGWIILESYFIPSIE